MAGKLQTGLGVGTVALSLKVFIVVMLFIQERPGICTAQMTLPPALQNKRTDMMNHFCSTGCAGSAGNCGQGQLNTLCEQICKKSCPNNCRNTTEGIPSLCNNNQNMICGYSDAAVCRYKDRRGTCVNRTNPPLTFCLCQNQEISYTGCALPNGIPTIQATVTQHTAQGATTPVTTDDQPVYNTTSVAAAVLGSLFALLLILVIIGAVILCLRRQGRLPSFMKQTANPAEPASVPLEARNVSRAKFPEPPVPGSGMEYSYANDHRPANPGAKEDSSLDDHTYYAVGEDGHTEGSHRYISVGQPTTKELDTATENAKDHPYFVLNRDEGDDEAINENGGRHGADVVEVTDSSAGVQSEDVINEDYTPLVPTGNPKARTEQSGDEVAASPTSPKVTSPIDSPTKGSSNGEDGTYFPLIPSAEPKPHMEQSEYEDANLPTSESPGSTSPTEAQPISGDDNTYTPLVRTAEPKSQKEHSGYQAAIITNPGLAADSDVTSPYDHFDRKEENKTKEGALSTGDVDDYQHLVNN